MAKLISIDELKEGMELELPVKNKFGQTLLSANLKLEEKHKSIFKMWGIETFYIKDNGANDEENKYDEEQKIKVKKMLELRMNWVPQNSNERDLYEMTLQGMLEKYF
ncbi:MAG: hypothetical protein M1480_07165 [Bacteroidetes bacterium]|nr:hypothetical protein [Bacteroidota bacterium]